MDDELRKMLQSMQSTINETRTEMKNGFKEIRVDIKDIKGDITNIKTQQEESYQILRILEDKADVNKADHDKMANDIIHLQGDVTEIKGDVVSIKKDLTNVEVITASNWGDIAKLKSIK